MKDTVEAKWVTTTIGEICDLVNGKAFKPKDWTEEGLPIVRIQNLNKPDAPFNRFSGGVPEKFLIDSGQLLFAWSGTPGTSFGAHIWKGGPAVLNQHIFKVEFDEQEIDKQFLSHAINQTLEELIGKAHGGVGLRHVTKGVFEATEIGIPPLPEQRRIVAKLDRLSARSAAARDHLARTTKLATRAKQAVLSAAVSGELTRTWRESRPDLDPWRVCTLGDVASGFNYGSASKSAPEGEVPVLRMGNIQDGRLDWTDLVFTSDAEEISKYELHSGEILFNRTNSPALVGKTAVYRGERPAIFAGYLIRVVCGTEVLPDFVNACLNSGIGRDYCWQVKTDGVSQSNINAKKLKAFPMNLPPVEEQREIIRRVDAAFTRLKNLTDEAGHAAHLIDRLDERLLAKAFRGELVPQDPDDEPAEALLARIREARAAAPKQKRGRGKKATAE